MTGLRGFASFLALAAGLALGLRTLHVALPLVSPQVPAAPRRLADPALARRHTGFSAWLPFYRPERLGARPVEVLVTHRPDPALRIVWRGERLLVLEQRRRFPAPPPSARPLAGRRGALAWQEGGLRRARLRVGELEIDVATDLELADLERLVASLTPLERLR
jgi:hypothetical protein